MTSLLPRRTITMTKASNSQVRKKVSVIDKMVSMIEKRQPPKAKNYPIDFD